MKTCRAKLHQYNSNLKRCPICKSITNKNCLAKNREAYNARAKISNKNWNDKNPEFQKNYRKAWNSLNLEYRSNYQKTQYKNNIQFRLANQLRSRLYKITKGIFKNGSAVSNLGCSLAELQKHLQDKFQPGMTWENQGKWHIDHIRPLASFDLQNPAEFKLACHYSNLQPLWAVDNIKKGKR
jgi:transposase-like protein